MRVFLSYAHADEPFARNLRAELERAEIAVATPAALEKELMPGALWLAALREIFEDCDAVLVVASKASSASEWVGRETSLALTSQRADSEPLPVIPVLAEAHAKIPLLLRSLFALDLSNEERLRSNIPRLVDAIKHSPELGRTQAASLEAALDSLAREKKLFDYATRRFHIALEARRLRFYSMMMTLLVSVNILAMVLFFAFDRIGAPGLIVQGALLGGLVPLILAFALRTKYKAKGDANAQ